MLLIAILAGVAITLGLGKIMPKSAVVMGVRFFTSIGFIVVGLAMVIPLAWIAGVIMFIADINYARKQGNNAVTPTR